MGFILDLRTLCIITSCICLSYGIGLALFNRAHIKRYNLLVFVAALLLVGAGAGLIALRGAATDFMSIIIANILIGWGFSCFLFGFSKFRQSNTGLAHLSGILLIPMTIGMAYFYYIEPSISARIVVIASFLAFTLFTTAYNVHRGLAKDSRLPVNVIVASFALFGTVELVRAIYFLLRPEEQFFSASDAAIFVLQLSYLFGTLNVAVTTFGLVWLINERLLETLKEMSFKDNLTDFFNRHALEQKLPLDIQSHLAQNKPLFALMLDIDYFKSINDTYGHQEGDAILQRCAQMFKSYLPNDHLAFRYGGEEFLVILYDCNLDSTIQTAENIRKSLELAQIAKVAGRSLTVSIGLAEMKPNDSVESLIKRADKALYQAKSQGRNQVVVEC